MFYLNQGHVLTTGAPGDKEKGYFRLHVNEYNNIETITCLSKQVRLLYGLLNTESSDWCLRNTCDCRGGNKRPEL